MFQNGNGRGAGWWCRAMLLMVLMYGGINHAGAANCAFYSK